MSNRFDSNSNFHNSHPNSFEEEASPNGKKYINEDYERSLGKELEGIKNYDTSIVEDNSEFKDFPPLPERELYVVMYLGPNDKEFPHNWKLIRKLFDSSAFACSMLALVMGSAMFAQGSEGIMMEFHVGYTVATLTTSLFIAGFASGPIIWGPLSELYGRKPILIISTFGYICFGFAVGAAEDIQTVILCRFFGGFIGAAPLTVSIAAMADIFDAKARGKATTIFAMVLFGSPMFAPVLGGFTAKNSSLGWRWTSYFPTLVACLALVLLIFSDESHHGIILIQKAKFLRQKTGIWGIYAPHELISLTLRDIIHKSIFKPIRMLFTEPILLLISVYSAFIYGMLYLFLTAVHIIFIDSYGFSEGVGQLPYISMLFGMLAGGLLNIYMDKRYLKAMKINNGKPVPEERLPPVMVGSVCFTVGLFWLGWAGGFGNRVHWIVPTIGMAPLGAGVILILKPCIGYIIECYLPSAASALAANTFLRSAFGAAFPLFARQMFVNMQIKWASTLAGFIAAILIPVPFLFYKYGRIIRAKSENAFH